MTGDREDRVLVGREVVLVELLLEVGIRPDTTASRHRQLTQPVARAVWDAGHYGLRWWSSFWGDWHTVVLFESRISGKIRFGEPEVLAVDHPAVETAAGLLGMFPA